MKPILSTSNTEILLERRKQPYCTNYFQKNFNDLKNAWKGIKKLISLKRTSNSLPFAVIENNITLTKSEDIANEFVNISSTIKSIIKFSTNKFHSFLPDTDINSFFIKPVDKTEIQNIILSLNLLKAVDPNSILTKIMKLLL